MVFHKRWAAYLRSSYLLACCLSVKYEVNQLRAVPDILYHIDKRVMRMSWSMVSKAGIGQAGSVQ